MSRVIQLVLCVSASAMAACETTSGASCTDSDTACDGNIARNCGRYCADLAPDCENIRSAVDCGETSQVCALAAGVAQCVLPAREACDFSGAGDRCAGDGSAIESCASVGFWSRGLSCEAGYSECVENAGYVECVLSPPERCGASSDDYIPRCDGDTVRGCGPIGYWTGHKCNGPCTETNNVIDCPSFD